MKVLKVGINGPGSALTSVRYKYGTGNGTRKHVFSISFSNSLIVYIPDPGFLRSCITGLQE